MTTALQEKAPRKPLNAPELSKDELKKQGELAIYYDSSKCTACRGCQAACKVWNELPSDIEKNAGTFSGSYQNPPDLLDNTRLIITFEERPREDRYGIDWAFGRRSCMHCTDAGCVKVCPSGCLYHDPDGTGLVVYDTEKCIGCQYCRSACPFDVPRHTGVGVTGGGIKINKCTGCVDRVRHGMAPACVSTCQPGALEFGPRDAMVAKARKRVEELHAMGFNEARVYGADELDGCHVIHVLKYGMNMYQKMPENPKVNDAVNALNIMKPVAGLAAVGIAAGLGFSYLRGVGYKRDEMLYDAESENVIDTTTDKVVRHIDHEGGER